jgi:hypothetical protein
MANDLKLTIVGFTSQEQINQFMSWYSGQGEQDIDYWLECRHDEGEVDCTSLNCCGIDTDNNVMTVRPS